MEKKERDRFSQIMPPEPETFWFDWLQFMDSLQVVSLFAWRVPCSSRKELRSKMAISPKRNKVLRCMCWFCSWTKLLSIMLQESESFFLPFPSFQNEFLPGQLYLLHKSAI
jgi:hypothetical protein